MKDLRVKACAWHTAVELKDSPLSCVYPSGDNTGLFISFLRGVARRDDNDIFHNNYPFVPLHNFNLITALLNHEGYGTLGASPAAHLLYHLTVYFGNIIAHSVWIISWKL